MADRRLADKAAQSYCSPPDTLGHMLWSLVVTLIILYFMLESTLIVFFEDTRAYIHTWLTLEYAALVSVLTLDIFVSLRRGVYVNGVLHQ